MSKSEKVWSVIAAAVAVSAVGIYIFNPFGKKKKTAATAVPPAPAPSVAAPNYTNSGTRIQSASTSATNVNLRSSASSKSPANVVANVASKNTYLGNVIEYVPDADGATDSAGDVYGWVHIAPKAPFTTLTKDFYVRADLVNTD